MIAEIFQLSFLYEGSIKIAHISVIWRAWLVLQDRIRNNDYMINYILNRRSYGR